ncbi:hypothetical protein JOL79_11630 [Microbispora sp. RL4-1S]|uniref:Uncharacterized protein n=1 Tax=Microbispora oryzae TaxID=2806554 RepID=A0A940WFA0_9ACTN|nr:hypothetical protein [Microbispora oryzae]MBP2704465.1 hypothetical protein [Microbispora oryzae]
MSALNSRPYADVAHSDSAIHPAAAAQYRELIQHAESKLADLLPEEARLEGNLTACRDVISEIRKSIDRYRAKLGEDVIGKPHMELVVPRPVLIAVGQEMPPVPLNCTGCGALLAIRHDQGIWSHRGRELLGEGYICWPGRSDSTVATPPAPQPATDLRVAGPVPEPGAAYPPGADCPACGDPMVADPQHGLIHQEQDGWVRAGEECKRRPAESTAVLPQLPDATR